MFDDKVSAARKDRKVLKLFQASRDQVPVVGRVHKNEVERAVWSKEAVETVGDVFTDDT